MKTVNNNDNFLESLNWDVKRGSSHSSEDVSISIVSGATKRSDKRVSVVLRNNVENDITNTNYIITAVHNNRIYFREAKANTGYSVSNKGKSNVNCYFVFTPSNIGDYINMIGDYELCFDPVHNVYYIEKEN